VVRLKRLIWEVDLKGAHALPCSTARSRVVNRDDTFILRDFAAHLTRDGTDGQQCNTNSGILVVVSPLLGNDKAEAGQRPIIPG
jgi:hypothetical protein